MFKDGAIDQVVARSLKKNLDERGWLVETFRIDEIDKTYYPAMSYASYTAPGAVRGPHEHREQADLFVFVGPGNFKISLWDNRKWSATYHCKQVFFAGDDSVLQLLIPPGVVHAYKNISTVPSLVLNFPNQLYRGHGKQFPVDEIRHESDPNTPFQCD